MSATIQIDPMALLEAKLVQKLEEKKRAGWIINHAQFYSEQEKRCCLIGAQCDEWPRYIDRYQEAPARILGITLPQARSLEWGFMDSSHEPEITLEPAYVALGQKLRGQYITPRS